MTIIRIAPDRPDVSHTGGYCTTGLFYGCLSFFSVPFFRLHVAGTGTERLYVWSTGKPLPRRPVPAVACGATFLVVLNPMIGGGLYEVARPQDYRLIWSGLR